MKKEEIFYNTSLFQVDLQLTSIKELKTRAGVLLGFTITFLGFIVSNEWLKEKITSAGYNIIPVYLILLSLFFFILSLVVKNYSYSPIPYLLYENYKNKNVKTILPHIIGELNTDFEENQKEMESLKKILNTGIFIEAVAIIWLIVIIFPPSLLLKSLC